MKIFFSQKTLIVYCISIIFAFSACTSNKEVKQPLSGSNWGVIPNSSAENLDPNSNVLEWSFAGNPAILFYSSEAKDGNRSLFIQSNEPSYGRWVCKVNVKPWSKYKFTGWIKTENLLNPEGEGAGFDLGIMAVAHEGFTGTNDRVEVSSVMALDYQGFTGTNDWVEVPSVFDTGDNLSLAVDPKEAWAMRHREIFPVNANFASKDSLLRVPGLGPGGRRRGVGGGHGPALGPPADGTERRVA